MAEVEEKCANMVYVRGHRREPNVIWSVHEEISNVYGKILGALKDVRQGSRIYWILSTLVYRPGVSKACARRF